MNEATLSTQAREAVLDFWRSHLACPAVGTPEFEGQATVVPHGAVFGEYNGAFAFRWGTGLVITVPNRIAAEMKTYIERQARGKGGVDSVFSPSFFSDLFGTTIDRMIGPACYGYLSRSDSPALTAILGAAELPGHLTRVLGPEDRDRLDRFSGRVNEDEWEVSGLDPKRTKHVFGILSGGAGDSLVSVSGYENWGQNIAQVGVATLAEARGLGHGARALATAAHHAIERSGRIAQYRTLRSLEVSMRLAAECGFEDLASSIAVRFKS